MFENNIFKLQKFQIFVTTALKSVSVCAFEYIFNMYYFNILKNVVIRDFLQTAVVREFQIHTAGFFQETFFQQLVNFLLPILKDGSS